MSTTSRRGFYRVPLMAQCGVCHQMTLQRFALNIWGGGLIINFCADCDTGHCPRCRAHPFNSAARTCTSCGQSLDPRNGTSLRDERFTAR